MSEDQKAEVKKLLWCYLTTPNSEIPAKVEKLKEYLEREKIPLSKLKYAFKETCPETHLRAIDATVKIVVPGIISQRKKTAA